MERRPQFIRLVLPDGRVDYLNPDHVVHVAWLPAGPETGDREAAVVTFAVPWSDGSPQRHYPVDDAGELTRLREALDAMTLRRPTL